MSIKILFKSSIAKILIIVLFLKIMLIMDFQFFLIYVYVYCYSKYWNEISLKKMSFIKNPITYCIGLKKVPHPRLSLCHTPSLFLTEIMKNQVLNKIV
jgi:hypothetical protein